MKVAPHDNNINTQLILVFIIDHYFDNIEIFEHLLIDAYTIIHQNFISFCSILSIT